MIVAGRRIPSATRSSLRPATLSRSLVKTSSYSDMPRPVPLSTDGPASKTFDWATVFSGENKARTISLLSIDRDNTSFNFKNYGKDAKKAAVLIPLCYDTQGRPGILYNLRSENLNSHKSEISFPGGSMDDEDNDDPIATALRETHEELGIPKEHVDIWTTCRVYPTVSSKFGVVPVLGFVNSGPVNAEALEINPAEVDHAFVIPLEHLCNPTNWDKMTPPGRIGTSIAFPTYTNMTTISGGLRGINLWGLTAFITHLVLLALLPQNYTRRVSYIELMSEDRDKRRQDGSVSKPTSKL